MVNVEQARVAEEAEGLRRHGSESRPRWYQGPTWGGPHERPTRIIKEIKNAVTIPVIAKVRIGHVVEAQILKAIGIDYVDESEASNLLLNP